MNINEMKTLAKFEVRLVEYDDENKTRIYSLYNSEGDYMGSIFPDDVEDSHINFLMSHQIIPETYADNTVCSIGKSLKDGFKVGDVLKEGDCACNGKWYGWSHRAICSWVDRGISKRPRSPIYVACRI